jgi:hypothetical protein
MTMSSSIQIQQDKQPGQLKLGLPQTTPPPLPSLLVAPYRLSPCTHELLLLLHRLHQPVQPFFQSVTLGRATPPDGPFSSLFAPGQTELVRDLGW